MELAISSVLHCGQPAAEVSVTTKLAQCGPTKDRKAIPPDGQWMTAKTKRRERMEEMLLADTAGGRGVRGGSF